jgi:hypothetical protein
VIARSIPGVSSSINRHGTPPPSSVSRLAPPDSTSLSHHACTCIPSHHLVFCQCQSAFVVISSLSYALPLRPSFCPPSPPLLSFSHTHPSVYLSLRSGLLLVFAGSATPGPPRTFMPISPSFYDFWLLAPTGTLTALHCTFIVPLSPNYAYSSFLFVSPHRVHTHTAHASLSPPRPCLVACLGRAIAASPLSTNPVYTDPTNPLTNRLISFSYCPI